MIVELSWSECRLVELAGCERRNLALHQRCQDRAGAPSVDRGWQMDIEGMFGEYVYAKAMGLFWSGADPRQAPDGDVARVQIRSTSRDNGSLIIRPYDPDGAVFVLVVGMPPRFRIPGWLPGGEGKRERWLRVDDRDPAYFVPQSALHPLAELEDGP